MPKKNTKSEKEQNKAKKMKEDAIRKASLRRKKMVKKFSRDKDVKEMILRRKVLNSHLSNTQTMNIQSSSSTVLSLAATSGSTDRVIEDETMPQMSKMEHFKKRLIHQLEEREQMEESTSAASSSESPPEADDNGKGDSKEKKERKKRISRKLFRHQDIEIFKPANDKSTAFLRQVHGRNSPPETESKTDAIVQLLNKNGDSGRIGKHHLPPMISDIPVRRKSSDFGVRPAHRPAQPEERTIPEVNSAPELNQSKSTESKNPAKLTVQRRKSVCAINSEHPIDGNTKNETDQSKRGRPPRIQPVVIRRNTIGSENYEVVSNMEHKKVSHPVLQADQSVLDLSKKNVEAPVQIFQFHKNAIQYNPLTIDQIPLRRNENLLRQQSYPPQYGYVNVPKSNIVDNDASIKVFMQLLPSFIANNNKLAVLVLNQKIAMIENCALSPAMRKIRDDMLNDISKYLRGKNTPNITSNGNAFVSQSPQYFLDPHIQHRKEALHQNSNPGHYNTDMFRNVEALAIPSQTQNQAIQNANNSLRNYRRQMSNKLEPPIAHNTVHHLNRALYNEPNIKLVIAPNQNPNNITSSLAKPHTVVCNSLEKQRYKPTNDLEISKAVVEKVTKKVETVPKGSLHNVQFLIPALKLINKDEIPSITEKVIPLEIAKETSFATPLTEKIVNVEINSQGYKQNLIVKEKEIRKDCVIVEKSTTSRGTSPMPIQKEVCPRKVESKMPDVVEIIEVKEEINTEKTGNIKMEIKSEKSIKEINNSNFKSVTKKLEPPDEEPIEIKDEDDELPQTVPSSCDDKNQKRKSISDPPAVFIKKPKSENADNSKNGQHHYSAPSMPDLNKNYIIANKNPAVVDKDILDSKPPPLIRIDEFPLHKAEVPTNAKKIQDLSSHDVRTILKSNIVAKSTNTDNQKVKNNPINPTQENRNQIQSNTSTVVKTNIKQNHSERRNYPYEKNMPVGKIIGISDDNRPVSPLITTVNELMMLKKSGLISPNFPKNHHDYPIRRNSFDTVSSLSDQSLYQEEIKSPTDKRVKPRGKLRYDRFNNTFERYFDDIQEKLYIQNVVNENNYTNVNNVEVIKIPASVVFQREGTIDDVAEFIDEFKKVEQYAPSDFFRFYRYVAGYQMLNSQSPIAFKTFLDLFNTRGLDDLLHKYLNGG